jgi:hypothetical protein
VYQVRGMADEVGRHARQVVGQIVLEIRDHSLRSGPKRGTCLNVPSLYPCLSPSMYPSFYRTSSELAVLDVSDRAVVDAKVGCRHRPHHPTPDWITKITDMHLFDRRELSPPG